MPQKTSHQRRKRNGQFKHSPVYGPNGGQYPIGKRREPQFNVRTAARRPYSYGYR